MNQESHITQNKDIKFLKGVGPKRAELYKKLNINTTFDLLQHYPRKYIDCTNPMKIADIPPFEAGVIKATVYNKTSGNLIKKNMMIFKVLVSDNVSNLLITIFNNKYLYDSLEVGKDYIFYGIISGNFIKREMSNPTVIALKNASTMKPIYKLTKGLSSNIIQSNVKTAFSIHENDLIEYLPKGIIQKYNLVGIKEAIKQIHFPENENKMQQAKNRLVFDELLILILALAQRGKNKKTKKVCGFQISFETNILDEFFQILPFELTIDQLKAIEDCRIDMEKPTPMARLIQGDVGSGKTLVSAAVMFLMAKSNFQSALMAPTEILAKQHFKTLYPIFEKLKIKTALLCGSTPKKEKLEIKQSLANGEIDILIGTHALITDDVTFKALGLVITDEQHRFGVKQRETIANKGKNPHVLVMSATPIPRSLG
ncbi:MAG: DEAD/DEAH box helicase, partial [Oscillospiraceae bacterium]